MKKSNYQAAIERIGKIKDFESLGRLEKSFDRLYKNNIFSEDQFLKLDALLIHKSNYLKSLKLINNN